MIDPIEDIKTIVKFVASNYLPDADAKIFPFGENVILDTDLV